MKKLILNIVVMLIGIASVLLFSSGNVAANPGSKDQNKLVQERMIQAESYFRIPSEPVIKFPEIYKVYDSDQNLVYESQDKKDQKLQNLIFKSDFLTEINNTHIYQLSR